MAGEVTDPKAKAVLAGGAATAAGATLAAGKLASKKKISRARREAIRKETSKERQAKLKQKGAREAARVRSLNNLTKAGDKEMANIRKKSAAADKALLKAAEKAEKQIIELRKIRDADINNRQKMIKKAHLSNQKAIIKGKAPKTVLQIARSIGLKSIPGIGAFISAISSTPAGKGSDRGLPNPEMNTGGLATKNYVNPVNVVDRRKLK